MAKLSPVTGFTVVAVAVLLLVLLTATTVHGFTSKTNAPPSPKLTTTTTTTRLHSFFPGANFDATGGRNRDRDRDRQRRQQYQQEEQQYSPTATATVARPFRTATSTTTTTTMPDILSPPLERGMPLVRPRSPPPPPSRTSSPSSRRSSQQQQRRRRYDEGIRQQQQRRNTPQGQGFGSNLETPLRRRQRNGSSTSGMSLLDMASSALLTTPQTLYEETVDVDTTTDLTTVQGNSLRTWSFPNPKINSVQVFLKTEGRPLNSVIELWNGPDNTPVKCAVYLEDGNQRAFSAIFATSSSKQTHTNSLSVKNTSPMEFPLVAAVEANHKPIHHFVEDCMTREGATHKTLQGDGSVCTVPLPPSVQSAAVLMRTQGRPLNARLELMQGPSNNKQILEIYSENGSDRPFFTIIETPGAIGTVIRVVNAGTIEFPITLNIQPYAVDPTLLWDEESWRKMYTPDDFFFAR